MMSPKSVSGSCPDWCVNTVEDHERCFAEWEEGGSAGNLGTEFSYRQEALIFQKKLRNIENICRLYGCPDDNIIPWLRDKLDKGVTWKNLSVGPVAQR